MDFVDPQLMFNDSYTYHTSSSKTMIKHFKKTAKMIQNRFGPNRILEIGSNDGTFLKNFGIAHGMGIEPCENFAQSTREMGFMTYGAFWNSSLSTEIVGRHRRFYTIYSANCISHIPDITETLEAVYFALEDSGAFIWEDPSLMEMIERNSYDQFYDEHAHVFSITALSNLLQKAGMEIFSVDKTQLHGASNRIYAQKIGGPHPHDGTLEIELEKENLAGLNKLKTYVDFAKRIRNSKTKLLELLQDIKDGGGKIVGYGATPKSTSVFNYCCIDSNLVDYIVDTDPDKQGKLSPGVHIPVVSLEEGFNDSVDYAFLGAWNCLEETTKKESKFLRRGGQFITHVPEVRILRREPVPVGGISN